MKPDVRSNAKHLSKSISRKKTARKLAALTVLAVSQSTLAAEEIKLGENAGLTAGFGLRSSYSSTKNGAPNGTSRSNDFEVESVRLFLSGHYNKIFKATFNTERKADDSIRVMDAIAQFEPMPEINVWLGRMLPPSDRSNLNGPYYIVPWSYPGVVSNYTNLAVGRDNGATIWGKPFGGKLVYAFGAFEGHNKHATLSGASDKLQFSGRLAFNILDPEPAPAYYTGSSYGGSKDILTVAIAGSTQADGAGTLANKGKLSIWSADVLFEKKFSFGVPTLEGAYYKYKVGAVDCGSGEPGATVCPVGNNIGGQVDGKAYLLGASFMILPKVGWGHFQPFVRYQKYERTLSNTTSKATDFGVNYLVDGPKVKVSAMYSKFEDNRILPVSAQDTNRFTLGVQYIF